MAAEVDLPWGMEYTVNENSEQQPEPTKPKRSKAIWLLGGLLVLAAIAAVVMLRPSASARELLRLLPLGADVYVAADVQALQRNLGVSRFLSDPTIMETDEDYEEFVSGTGFVYQRDLRAVVLAKTGPDWMGAARGDFDRERIIQYLESQGAKKTEELGETIYSFGKVRPFRLVLGENDEALFTAGAGEDAIRQMIRRRQQPEAKTAVHEFAQADEGKNFLNGSEVEMVGNAEKMLSSDGTSTLVMSILRATLRGSRRIYASADSGLTAIDFRVEVACDNEADAESITTGLNIVMELVQNLPAGNGDGIEQKLPALMEGVTVEQAGKSVVMQWRWDRETSERLNASAPNEKD